MADGDVRGPGFSPVRNSIRAVVTGVIDCARGLAKYLAWCSVFLYIVGDANNSRSKTWNEAVEPEGWCFEAYR